jgi:hypothetical protein
MLLYLVDNSQHQKKKNMIDFTWQKSERKISQHHLEDPTQVKFMRRRLILVIGFGLDFFKHCYLEGCV